MTGFVTRPRSRTTAIIFAVFISMAYVLLTFDTRFLLGAGPFWTNPAGPWLQDPQDRVYNKDMLQLLIGYHGFLHTGWHLPLFFVRELGWPSGTNIIFLDSIPIVALAGKLASALAGVAVNPYGVWVAACFILSAVCATLFVFEEGQESLLAAVAASLLVITAPPFLHRFGHLSLLSHFIVIGALLFYVRDRRLPASWTRPWLWAAWLSLAALINIYIFAMAGILYAASQLRSWRAERPSVVSASKEPALVAVALLGVFVIAGHLSGGANTTPFAWGFGHFSMNLASPFWPQRSGLFPGFDAIVDATDGQYEGFAYLGFGALLIVAAAIMLNFRRIRAKLTGHRELTAALAGLLLFSLSDRVFVGNLKLLDFDYSGHLDEMVGMFRSSGRMFWPVLYALVLFGLVGVLRHVRPAPAVAFVLACCVLQLVDTNPLRSRLSRLTAHETPRLLDHAEWQARMMRAARVEIDPSYQCKGQTDGTANLELQLAAARTGRPINSVYNARLKPDPEMCRRAALASRNGPWLDDTLYVYLAGGPNGVANGWMPPRQSCEPFSHGVWCLGQSRRTPGPNVTPAPGAVGMK